MATPYTKEQSTFHAEREKKEAKKPKPIAKKSAKRIEEEKLYRGIRKNYLIAFPFCEVGCGMASDQIHHKKGRIGKLLTNARYFMAVCDLCHKKIHEKPKWSYKNNYMIKRL